MTKTGELSVFHDRISTDVKVALCTVFVGYFFLGCGSTSPDENHGKFGVLSFEWADYVSCPEDHCALNALELSLTPDPDVPDPPFMPPTWFTVRSLDEVPLSVDVSFESSDPSVALIADSACGVSEVMPYRFEGLECGDVETSDVLSAAIVLVSAGSFTVRVIGPDGDVVDEYDLEVDP